MKCKMPCLYRDKNGWCVHYEVWCDLVVECLRCDVCWKLGTCIELVDFNNYEGFGKYVEVYFKK